MAYSFSSRPPVSRQIRHIIRQQLQGAIESLSLASGPEAMRIHETRKHLKKARAVTALTQSSDAGWRQELEACLKRIAHELAPFRDADSLRSILLQLRRDHEAEYGSRLFDTVQSGLEQQFLSTGRTSAAFIQTGPELARLLQDQLSKSDLWDLTETTTASIFRQIKKRYGQGRQRLRDALENANLEVIHSWRKAAKDHWYHLRLLKKSWPRLLQARAIDCSTLCDLLGKDHDLGLLWKMIQESTMAISTGSFTDIEPFLQLVEYERAGVQSRAFYLGKLIFSEPKQALHRRLFNYWKTWRVQ